MNIIITLPTKLANLIYEGVKTIEVRKNFPKQFNHKKDVVYICEKGTNHVTGMFILKTVTKSKNPNQVWEQHSKAICIDEKWWNQYTENTRTLYLWHIMQSERFLKPYSLQDVFGIKTAPQSYMYSDIEWFLNEDFNFQVETKIKKAVQ